MGRDIVAACSATALFVLLSCAGTSSPPSKSPSTRSSATAQLSKAQEQYYRQAFPEAHRFVVRQIPKQMIRAANKGNTTYVSVKDVQGGVVGYLRDINVSISPAAECECDPLVVTLAFNKDLSLRTLISPAPLHKRDKAIMSAVEMQRLIDIARSPSPEIVAVKYVEEMVDAVSGATKPALQQLVVPHAALSTHRVVGLVNDTRKILEEAPKSGDRASLTKAVQSASGPDEIAKALLVELANLETDEARLQTYALMGRAYVRGLQDNAPPHTDIETALLQPPSPIQSSWGELAGICYDLASSNLRLDFAQRCAAVLEAQQPPGGVAPAILHRLTGTLLFARGELHAALAHLEKAASGIAGAQDPGLHLRLAKSLFASGTPKKACDSAAEAYRAHPLYPDLKEALEPCRTASGTPLRAQLDRIRREKIQQDRLGGGPKAPTLEVEGDQMQPFDLELAQPGKYTIAVFFSTWCPHCQAEMPRLTALQQTIASSPKLRDKVRLLGIRTAVEKETESFDAFVQRFELNFPVWTDATMSLAFSRFAKTMQIPAGLPTIAILNEDGIVEFLLDSGDYKDTYQEILWALESLL